MNSSKQMINIITQLVYKFFNSRVFIHYFSKSIRTSQEEIYQDPNSIRSGGIKITSSPSQFWLALPLRTKVLVGKLPIKTSGGSVIFVLPRAKSSRSTGMECSSHSESFKDSMGSLKNFLLRFQFLGCTRWNIVMTVLGMKIVQLKRKLDKYEMRGRD